MEMCLQMERGGLTEERSSLFWLRSINNTVTEGRSLLTASCSANRLSKKEKEKFILGVFYGILMLSVKIKLFSVSMSGKWRLQSLNIGYWTLDCIKAQSHRLSYSLNNTRHQAQS